MSAPAICAVINSVLDFDIKSGRTSTEGADALIAAVKEHGWRTEWVLETHAHADHLTSAPYVKAQLGGKLGIGANIPAVQAAFSTIYNLGSDFASGAADRPAVRRGRRFRIGGLTARVMATPGHTPACITYESATRSIGDTMFAPDYGTARYTFRAAMPARSIARSRSWRCRRKRGCTSATTIRRTAANRGRVRPSPSSAGQRSSGRQAQEAFVAMREARTRPWTCRSCCCPPCR